MFKKLLNLFGGDKDADNKTTSSGDINSRTGYSEEQDDDDDYEEDDDDDDDDEWPEEELGQKVDVELDPVTLHGTNYTEEEFDAEVERRVEAHIEDDKADGEKLSQKDIDNYYFNIRREVYQEWTGANSNMMLQWEQANSMKFTGIASYGNAKHDENNPLLEPIHGLTLEDYAAISYNLASGADFNAILSLLGIDAAIWQEANTLWAKRMQEDSSFTVATLFSQYYNSADKHPKLSAVAVELSDKGKETVEKMKVDRYFYEELSGARSAAYEYGIDGAQWILDNYGVPLGEFQKIAASHSESDQKQIDMKQQKEYADHMYAKMEEYKKKFAEEQGGNVADDIEF